ncbi:TPA: GNAT family N-acetyltransferase [Candidatus Woesearchaeota archaeon]|nr:MAG: GCN5-like protein N-acetyltransferase [archaeon GW2011_AR11]MBS3110528.1 GNAT family N-acetyltransferase [Candidatus Woesearchaeota archaeon]HIH05460.1 GNAT family N-acetyltransferase [Candidatus Woesearchaeota archaeon]HIH91787.1 GNAT family N-acetyltransferase [Candidatus Woesearchaeota archaeon]HII65045.1 GNAT family N-acetyltransferase [Candidatus Woesearchaeota archaeon]
MAWKKQLALPDGKVVALRDLSRKDSPKELADFINSFLKEKAYLRINRKISVAEEKAWIRSRLKGMKKGNIIHLHLECKGKLVGVVDAERGEYKHHGNVFLGITILPPFRSKGLGEFALRELIARAKSEMKPKNIYLTVYTDNKKAIRLYRKLGFVRHHVLKNWINHYGRYLDEEFYILKR